MCIYSYVYIYIFRCQTHTFVFCQQWYLPVIRKGTNPSARDVMNCVSAKKLLLELLKSGFSDHFDVWSEVVV